MSCCRDLTLSHVTLRVYKRFAHYKYFVIAHVKALMSRMQICGSFSLKCPPKIPGLASSLMVSLPERVF